ncbi:hypothetical protein VNO78_22824 [Psophocarpus tetragonolobus]|uniref:Uncharacterized protein n=1 Tax=Psophocarpus tetragonolobus TaxID=3891 RepID=A0AAN9S5K1_PSOTE
MLWCWSNTHAAVQGRSKRLSLTSLICMSLGGHKTDHLREAVVSERKENAKSMKLLEMFTEKILEVSNVSSEIVHEVEVKKTLSSHDVGKANLVNVPTRINRGKKGGGIKLNNRESCEERSRMNEEAKEEDRIGSLQTSERVVIRIWNIGRELEMTCQDE